MGKWLIKKQRGCLQIQGFGPKNSRKKRRHFWISKLPHFYQNHEKWPFFTCEWRLFPIWVFWCRHILFSHQWRHMNHPLSPWALKRRQNRKWRLSISINSRKSPFLQVKKTFLNFIKGAIDVEPLILLTQIKRHVF